MAAPIVAARTRYVPPKGARIDPGHPLASGLEICFIPAYGPVELAKGYTVTKGGSPSAGLTNGFGPSGRITASTSDYWQIAAPDAPFLGTLTASYIHRNVDATTNRCYIGMMPATVYNSPFEIYYSVASSPQTFNLYRRDASAFAGYVVASSIPVNTDCHVVAAIPSTVSKNDKIDLWVNGKYYTYTPPDTGLTPTGGNAGLRIGRRADNGIQSYGDFAIVALWSRRLNAAEAAMLIANPFCFLRW